MYKQIKDTKLKEFMQDHFDFKTMKKVVFFKGIKFNDYEAQAAKVCHFFGLESIYDYANIGRGEYCHISYANPTSFTRFIEPIGPPLMQVEGKTAKIIPFK
jgi:hypothetical protein